MSPFAALKIVIIGGTRGIGLELCHHLAESGHNIALCGRSSNAEEVALSLAQQYKITAFGQAVDATDAIGCAEFASKAANLLGGIDVLFANAAIFGPVGTIENVDISRWAETINTNTLTFINPVRAFLPYLRRSTSACILTMSGGGLGGPRPIKRASAYFASKAATVSLIEVLAEELIHEQITVNAIAPGFFPTDFMREAAEVGADIAGPELHSDASRQADDSVVETLRQLTTLVDFLISSDAREVTGRTLSARWDTSDKIIESRASSNLFRLRRVDNDLIREAP